jgi:hypothetical protein
MNKLFLGALALVSLSFSSLTMANPADYCPPGWHIGGTPLACQPPSDHNDAED